MSLETDTNAPQRTPEQEGRRVLVLEAFSLDTAMCTKYGFGGHDVDIDGVDLADITDANLHNLQGAFAGDYPEAYAAATAEIARRAMFTNTTPPAADPQPAPLPPPSVPENSNQLGAAPNTASPPPPDTSAPVAVPEPVTASAPVDVTTPAVPQDAPVQAEPVTDTPATAVVAADQTPAAPAPEAVTAPVTEAVTQPVTALTTIPADEALHAETNDGLVMFMAANGVGPATSREHAIELLKAARDKLAADVLVVDADVAAVGAAVAEMDVAQDGSTPGSVWNNAHQLWVMPDAA
jgi:hypothetical protein